MVHVPSGWRASGSVLVDQPLKSPASVTWDASPANVNWTPSGVTRGGAASPATATELPAPLYTNRTPSAALARAAPAVAAPAVAVEAALPGGGPLLQPPAQPELAAASNAMDARRDQVIGISSIRRLRSGG